jgi:hypothetical protein
MTRQQIAKKSLQGSELSADRALLSTRGQRGHVRADHMNVDPSKIDMATGVVGELPLAQKPAKLTQVASIVPQGVRRHVALVTKVISVLLDQLFQRASRQQSQYHAWRWNEIILPVVVQFDSDGHYTNRERFPRISPTFSTRIEIRFFYGCESEKVLSFHGVRVSKWL